MRDAPDIPPGLIAATLEQAYAVRAAVDFLPLGHDSAAWAFRADADDGAAYFVKLRRLPLDPMVALVPRALHDRGVSRVLAALPTVDGAPYAVAGDYGVVVQPYVPGHTAIDDGLSDEQWTVLGTTARQIHDAALDADLLAGIPRETFRPKWAGVLREWADARAVDRLIASTEPADSIAAGTAAFWRERRDVIREVVDRAAQLADTARRAEQPRVVCHADLHTGNVLVDERGELHLIDWDEVVLAPRERDLMFVVDGGISRDLAPLRGERAFLAGYGDVDVHRPTLAYYKFAWAVQDISEYATQAFTRHELSPETRAAALDILRTLFATGEIVELARAADV